MLLRDNCGMVIGLPFLCYFFFKTFLKGKPKCTDQYEYEYEIVVLVSVKFDCWEVLESLAERYFINKQLRSVMILIDWGQRFLK